MKKGKHASERKGGRPSRDMQRFSLHLNVGQLELMREIAEREGLVVADIVRRACRELIERDKATRGRSK